MHVVVGICTWNRAGLLQRTLESFRRLVVPEGTTWEIVLADNNSTDDTPRVAAEFARVLPLARIFVPRQGKSHALNAAIDAMRGDLTVWTDDDVEVDPRWLASYVRAARRSPDAAFFGGPIEAAFLERPPAWIKNAWRTLSCIYGERDLGDQAFDLCPKTLPFGANWAVRTDVQKRFRYDGRLGRVGNGMLAGEETEVALRMLAAGLRGRWTPEARVAHFVTPERMTLDFVTRYFFGAGRSKVARRYRCGPAITALGMWLLGLYYEAESRLRGLGEDPSPRAVRCLAKAANAWGRLQALGRVPGISRLPNRVAALLADDDQPRAIVAPSIPAPRKIA
ncbi:MAG: glycosyltransferase [Pirellulales bacterium]